MKKKWFLVFSLGILLSVVVSPPVQARSMIYDILAKGSEWTLNVDGEVGTLELLGGKGSRTRDGGWVMTMEIRWQNNAGTLRAQADGNNSEQHVVLRVERKNGLKVNCEGYVAMETARFMGGITRHAARPQDLHGAWYATILKRGKELSDRTSTEKPEKPETSAITIKPGIKIVEKHKIAPYVIKGTGSISGRVYGRGLKAVNVFFVSLYGPNDFRTSRGTEKFDAPGAYMFKGLANGKYKVVVGTKADIAIGPHPRYRIVKCTGGAVKNVNFELK
jgi:hypothetical protein